MLPRVTVVIPTRNRMSMLRQALSSALCQDVDLEVLVVDEGSTDGTSALLDGWPDARLRIIRHREPKGPARARNAAIEQASGEVVAFLDDDDLWFPGKLQAQLEAMAAAGADWAFGGAIIFSEGPRLEAIVESPAPAAAVARMAFVNMVPGGGSNAVVDKGVLEAVGGFATDLPSVEDWDLWIRLSSLGEPAVTGTIVTAYRRHGGNMSRAIAQTLASASELDRRYRTLRGDAPLDWADLLHWLSSDALRAGDRRTARRLALRALRERHPAAGKRLLQSLSPVPRRPPIPAPREPINLYERVRPPRVIPWPPGMQVQLQQMLGSTDAT